MVTSVDEVVLTCIARYRHPTTAQVHRYALPEHNRRYVERVLTRLRQGGLIDVHLLYPEQGARSPRYYHLLQKGARAIGLTRLGSVHYRHEQRVYYAARMVRLELVEIAHRRGWSLVVDETECHQVLLSYLAALAHAEHGTSPGEEAPAYLLDALVPEKIQPDSLLSTVHEVVPIIIAHPHAGPAFWRERLHRYARVINRVRAVCVPLTQAQQADAKRVIAASAWARRYLILPPDRLDELIHRLA